MNDPQEAPRQVPIPPGMTDDPALEPGEQVYVVLPTGTRFGPATIAEVSEWARKGQVPRASTIMAAKSGIPYPLSAFPEIERAIPVSTVEKFIPRNNKAVIAYYLAVFSPVGCLLCFLPGGVMGIAGVVLGVLALKDAKENPMLGGQKHAWFSILFGGLVTLLSLASTVLMFLPHLL